MKAVDGVSLHVEEGETLALVGESGSGKTTTGFLVLGLISPTGGEVYFRGENIYALGARELRKRRPMMQMIFQDPYGSLNPRITVGKMLEETLSFHNVVEPGFIKDRISELLNLVGLDSSYACRYPHEFSGGERQRVGIARAVSLEPRMIVADEPVSALDVSIRGQILNLLLDLQKKLGISYLFIAHDLAVVRCISHRVAVMYLGKIVEEASTEELFNNPLHPYTKILLSSVPVPDPEMRGRRKITPGEIPDIPVETGGCKFLDRCPAAGDMCKKSEPELARAADGHLAACHMIHTTVENENKK